MASHPVVQHRTGTSTEAIFSGDGVRLAGQMDYPTSSRNANELPLLFIVHHATCNTRDSYLHYAQIGTELGFAVFRWDKRGTGRSGAGGRGSTVQDALNAYEVALNQPGINRDAAIILALGSGSNLLANTFDRFKQIQPPRGVVLVANMLDRDEIVKIDVPVQIVLGQNDWNPTHTYGEAALEAHLSSGQPTDLYIAQNADRLLMTDDEFHAGARKAIGSWITRLLTR